MDGIVAKRIRRTGAMLLAASILALVTSSSALATAPVPIPIAASDHTCVVTIDHAVACWGDNSKGALGDGTTTTSAYPVKVPNFSEPSPFRASSGPVSARPTFVSTASLILIVDE